MSSPLEAEIAALAARQHRCVTRQQLLGLGLGSAAISYRARTARLHRVHVNVYVLGPPPGTPLEFAAAAVLACGNGAALSHSSALALWGLQPHKKGPVHVTARGQRRRPGLVVHVSGTLTAADVRLQLGLRVTSPARTVFDCAAELGSRLPRVIDDGRIAGLLHLAALADLAQRLNNHPGRAAIAQHLGLEAGPTRSDFELAFLAFCTRFGLPHPRINVTVAGFEADAWFARQRVVVELDGWRFHQGKTRFESDRERDAARLAVGIVTYRMTWRRLIDTPQREAQRLRAVLASRESRPGPRSERRT